MQPGRYDMVIPRGASFAKEFARYKDEAEQEPFDYTGYTFEWIIGTTMTLKLGEGLELPELHVVRLALTPTDTVKAANFQQDHHKLWLHRPDGGMDPLLHGVVTWKTP
jgi:hypothetical protein